MLLRRAACYGELALSWGTHNTIRPFLYSYIVRTRVGR
jgi:hypothetical protein